MISIIGEGSVIKLQSCENNLLKTVLKNLSTTCAINKCRGLKYIFRNFFLWEIFMFHKQYALYHKISHIYVPTV